MRPGLLLLAWPLLLSLRVVAAPALAAGPGHADDSAERLRIAAERQSVEQRFAADQAACRQRFLVNECLVAARAERRQALDHLQRQLIVLDDALRRARAADRLQAIQERQREVDRRAAPALTPRPRQPAAPPSVPVPRGASAPAHDRRAPTDAQSQAQAQAQAQRHRADFDQRQREAEAHRQAVEARNQRQDAKRPPTAGLPVPAASASPR